MVQTYQSPVRVYKYPFELVMAAYEKRFPTCPMMPILVGSEIVNEYESPDGSIKVTERKCKLRVDAPYILRKVKYFRSPETRWTSVIKCRIFPFNRLCQTFEIFPLQVHPENGEWTSYEQRACLDAKSFYGFESVVEKIAVKHYAENVQKGKEILETHIMELRSEGIDHIPPFKCEVAETSFASEAPWYRSFRVYALFCYNCFCLALRLKMTSKLESEYIQRFLGQLTALEESRLVELRSSLVNANTGKIPNDAHLLRFLRAADFDVDRGQEMVVKSMMWRKQHNVDRILSTYNTPVVFADYFPGFWHNYDLEGRPLYIFRLGQLDFKGLLRAVGEEGIMKHVLNFCEEGLSRTEEATKIFGKPISAWTLLVDLDGMSIRHLWRPAIRTLLDIIEIVQENYPETMGSMLIVRAPRVFPILWTLVSPFINEKTANKFMIYGGSDYANCLCQYMEQKWIPDFLGGPCPVNIPGGLIPESLYRLEYSAAFRHGLEQVYNTAYVYKGYPFEAFVPVADTGSVLTWDFDVIKGACSFCILFTERIIITDASNPSSAGSGGHSLLADRTLTLGVDLIVLSNEHCDEGDSVQGSHVCNNKGTYILQWRSTEMPSSGQLSFDFALPLSNKCKVVYHHELLSSESYNDLVVSLESCRSSFSSLNLRMNGQSGLSIDKSLDQPEQVDANCVAPN
ncbi:PRELI and CRAL TRIO domain containing protein [Trichuris trichiura]|uniref:PRELI and CRAL TRIO domain containing protein n=1 Tax=Trichuris trichiura TaxID=36087 RepID=A0A077YW73_TRITR|nr:PRELI and CRAL TRIO domain containing protein [Trichuris trichiura]